MDRKKLPDSFYNPITLLGFLITVIAFFSIAFLFLIDVFSPYPNPYLGLITYMLSPAIMVFGILLILFGIRRKYKKIKSGKIEQKKLPIIDFNNPKHMRATYLLGVGGFVFILISAIGVSLSFSYTESDEFCGLLCHKVMDPEYTAYQHSPHSKVGCVKCHIGAGADWFVKSKLSGLYQVYAILTNSYDKPIPTPISNLRPAQQTCEQCHWPKHFYYENEKKFNYYLSNEDNSKSSITMLLKVGGGNLESGNHSGIHWNMNIANEITYIPIDEKRNIIPWVKSKSLINGSVSIYKSTDTTLDISKYKDKMRIMDCIDCHNRPTHIYKPPHTMVNSYMAIGVIDPTLPYIKSLGVQVLETYYSSKDKVYDYMKSFITSFYKSNYPQVAEAKNGAIQKSIDQIYQIYENNYFPEMKVSWRNFPDNIGHIYNPGCFRCHDGKHVNEQGKVLSNDCNLCHTMIEEELPNQPKRQSASGIQFVHPGNDMGSYVSGRKCLTCHRLKF